MMYQFTAKKTSPTIETCGKRMVDLYNAARTSDGLTLLSISNFVCLLVCLLELGIYNFACGSAVMLSVMDHTNITQGSKN